ncbi:MAG: PorT family protein [Chitinophagaceae bacterium]|nr:MAG: PorT family protein [Chitinophagaceae bacterium]
MKARLPFLLAALLAAQVSIAQFNIGPKAGVNLTKIEGKSFREGFQTGYHLGAFMEIGLGKKWHLQPELLFNQVQGRYDTAFSQVYQNAFSDASSGNVKLNYLSIPLLLNYHVGNALSLQAGPQFGILINKDKNLLQNGSEAFKGGDLALLGGAQLHLSKLRFTGRYGVGLSNLNDITTKEKWKSQTIQLSVGFAL